MGPTTIPRGATQRRVPCIIKFWFGVVLKTGATWGPAERKFYVFLTAPRGGGKQKKIALRAK